MAVDQITPITPRDVQDDILRIKLNELVEKVNGMTDLLEVAKGNIAGHKAVNKFGRNTDIDAGTPEDIWDGGGTWVAPTQARVHNIASTDTNDDGSPAGTGAQTVVVFGLTSWDTAETSETITMNGTTNVATSNSYVIIHRMRVATFGSSGPNVGTITATAVTDGTVTAQINAMEGQTQMAIYGIPSTQTAYMYRWYASINRVASSVTDMSVLFNPIPDTELSGYLVKSTESVATQGTSAADHNFSPPNKFSGPGIFKLRADPSANNTDISAGFDLVLVDN